MTCDVWHVSRQSALWQGSGHTGPGWLTETDAGAHQTQHTSQWRSLHRNKGKILERVENAKVPKKVFLFVVRFQYLSLMAIL